ncbi:MAG: PAC2 family protein [bacterium]
MAFDLTREPGNRIPVLVAGWPGMGNVGLAAVEYLRRKLDARLCARLDITDCVFPEAIEVEQGIGRLQVPAPQALYLVEEPPLLLFEGSLQPGGRAGARIADELIEFARAHGVETVYTGAAFATPMSFRDEVQVFGVSTADRLRDGFVALGVQPLGEGRISGLNGLLLGLAAHRGLAGTCFLATMPHYAVQTPNPKASRALVRVFERLLNTGIDTDDLDREVEQVDQLLGKFESRVNAALSDLRARLEGNAESDESEEGDDRETPVPEPREMMERIERLFAAACADRGKARELKRELDRWGLFGAYEDRFLDLFSSDRRQHD